MRHHLGTDRHQFLEPGHDLDAGTRRERAHMDPRAGDVRGGQRTADAEQFGERRPGRGEGLHRRMLDFLLGLLGEALDQRRRMRRDARNAARLAHHLHDALQLEIVVADHEVRIAAIGEEELEGDGAHVGHLGDALARRTDQRLDGKIDMRLLFADLLLELEGLRRRGPRLLGRHQHHRRDAARRRRPRRAVEIVESRRLEEEWRAPSDDVEVWRNGTWSRGVPSGPARGCSARGSTG